MRGRPAGVLLCLVAALAVAPPAAQAAPTNDDRANARVIALGSLPVTVAASTAGATPDTGGRVDPTDCVPRGRSVWFRLGEVSTPTPVRMRTVGGDDFLGLALYRRTPAGLVPVACERESAVELLPGATYLLLAASPNATPTSAVVLSRARPPANDARSAAVDVPLDALPFSRTQGSVDATRDTGGVADPAPPCGADGFTVWYRMTTGATPRTVRIATTSPLFAPQVNLYREVAGDLVPVRCVTGTRTQLAAGTTYYVMLTNVFTGDPRFTFSVTDPPAPR